MKKLKAKTQLDIILLMHGTNSIIITIVFMHKMMMMYLCNSDRTDIILIGLIPILLLCSLSVMIFIAVAIKVIEEMIKYGNIKHK